MEFLPLGAAETDVAACGDGTSFGGTLDGQADSTGGALSGLFGGSQSNCVTGETTLTRGSVDVTQTEGQGTTGTLTFGISKERASGNQITGRFIEGYVSRNSVDRPDLDGTINGVGLQGGLYHARALESGLKFNAYGSLAAGRHSFDLQGGGNVTGDYTYAGVFAGAALSGETTTGAFVIKPRGGIDLAYAQTVGEIFNVGGDFDIDPANYARGFFELELEHDLSDAGAGVTGTLSITPRVLCETTGASGESECGYGAALGYTGATLNDGSTWAFTLEHEEAGQTKTSSASAHYTRTILNGAGVARSAVSLVTYGVPQIEQNFEFSW